MPSTSKLMEIKTMAYTTIKPSQANINPNQLHGWYWNPYSLVGILLKAFQSSNFLDDYYLKYLTFKVSKLERFPAGNLTNGSTVHKDLYSVVVYITSEITGNIPTEEQVQKSLADCNVPSHIKVKSIVGGFQFYGIW